MAARRIARLCGTDSSTQWWHHPAHNARHCMHPSSAPAASRAPAGCQRAPAGRTHAPLRHRQRLLVPEVPPAPAQQVVAAVHHRVVGKLQADRENGQQCSSSVNVAAAGSFAHPLARPITCIRPMPLCSPALSAPPRQAKSPAAQPGSRGQQAMPAARRYQCKLHPTQPPDREVQMDGWLPACLHQGRRQVPAQLWAPRCPPVLRVVSLGVGRG